MAHAIVIARWLDPYRVGVFSLLSYVLSVAGTLSDLGLPAAAMKLVSEEEAGRRESLRGILITVSSAMLIMATLTGLLLFFASDDLASFYREPALALLFKAGALLLFFSLLGALLSGILQGFQKIEVLAVVGPAKGLTALLATLFLLPPWGLLGILLAMMLAEVIGGLLMAKPLHRAISPAWSSGRMSCSGAILRRILSLSVPIFLHGLLLWGTPWLVRSYLAHARGYQEVGFFQVADSFSRLLLLLPGAIAVPFAPAVSELSALAPVQVAGLADTTLRWGLLVTLPNALFLFLAAQPLVMFVYGSPYAEAGSLAAFLMMAVFFQSLNVMIWSVLIGTGRVWAGFLIQLTGQMLLLAFTVALVPPFGLIGLGMAHQAASGLSLLLSLTYTRARLGVALASVKALVPIGCFGWLLAWGLYAAGGGGVLQALLVAGGMLVLEGLQLNEEERSGLNRWIRRMLPWRVG